MTREEAIHTIRNMISYGAEEVMSNEKEALHMAIEALSADTVSREMREPTDEERASVKRYIDSISADVVSVVRCKDCRHGWYDDDIEYYVCRHPKGLNEELYGVDYCSYGELAEQTDFKGGKVAPKEVKDEWQKAIKEIAEASRPHGEWQLSKCTVDGKKYIEYCKCSICGAEFILSWDFCPSCGADMRGDKDD